MGRIISPGFTPFPGPYNGGDIVVTRDGRRGTVCAYLSGSGILTYDVDFNRTEPGQPIEFGPGKDPFGNRGEFHPQELALFQRAPLYVVESI